MNFASKPSYRLDAVALLRALQEDPACQIIAAGNDLFESGITLFSERPDKNWSLTDCISFAIMRQHGINQALAYDHHFEQAGFRALLREEPTAP